MRTINEVLCGLLSSTTEVLTRSEIRELLKLTRKPGVISFAGGLPNPGLFPADELKEAAVRVLEKEADIVLQYGPTEGDNRLIEYIVKWMKEDEGAEINEENILIVSGSQQALDLVAKVFIDPGDPIIVGLPSYLGGLQAFSSYRARMIGVKVDKQGMDVEAVENILKRQRERGEKIKFIYVVPDFQNPSGVTMTLERREKLLALCYEYETIVVEDSPYRELRFEGDSIPMVGAMDKKGYAFSIHTFSKILCPGMRLGWVIANKAIMDKLVMAKQPSDLCTSPFTQAVVSEFLSRNQFKSHIQKIVRVYKRKRDVMLAALERYMPGGEMIEWTHPQGGLFLWVTLPKKVNTENMFLKAVDKGVAYVVGSAFHFDRSGKNTMRLNFSFPSEGQIEEGIKRLAEVIKNELSER